MSSIEIRWVSLAEAVDAGLPAMVRRHWDEVGVHKDLMPLKPDWARYERMEEEGVLRLVGGWAGDELVAYSSFIVMPGLHYTGTLHATNDAIFVEPGRRGLGIQLIRETERLLIAFAKPAHVRIVYHDKLSVGMGRVFERLGYVAFETVRDKIVVGA